MRAIRFVRNSAEREDVMGNKTKTNLIVAAFSFLIACGCFVMMSNETDYHIDEPEIEFSEDNGYEELEDSRIKIHAFTGVTVPHGGVVKGVDLSNDESNHYNEVISIYLSNGLLVYESDCLSPGECVEEALFDDAERPGKYNGVAVYSFYTRNENKFVNRCEIPIEINYVDFG